MSELLDDLKERLRVHFENEENIMRDAIKLPSEEVRELREYMWTLPHAQKFKNYFEKKAELKQ